MLDEFGLSTEDPLVFAIIFGVVAVAFAIAILLVGRYRRTKANASKAKRLSQSGGRDHAAGRNATAEDRTPMNQSDVSFPPKTLSIWLEKINGEGQDARPVIAVTDDFSFGVMGVFDGMGGRGGTKYAVYDGHFSGALLAAQASAEALEDYVNDVIARSVAYVPNPTRQAHTPTPSINSNHQVDITYSDPQTNSDTVVATEAAAVAHRQALPQKCEAIQFAPNDIASNQSFVYGGWITAVRASEIRRQFATERLLQMETDRLTQFFDRALARINAALPQPEAPGRLRAKVMTKLPTTVAGLIYWTEGEQITITYFWAGDSRVYYLSNTGLMQLSVDDTKSDPAAAEDLSQDAPLTNYLSEDKPNRLGVNTCRMGGPGLVICCTDGAYGFLNSPMHFEHLILATILGEGTPEAACSRLAEHLQAIAGDDVTVIIHPVGFATIEEMRRALKPRLELVSKTYVEPIDAINKKIADLKEKKLSIDQDLDGAQKARSETLKDLWGQYRRNYRPSSEA